MTLMLRLSLTEACSFFVAKPHYGGLFLTKFDTKECYQGSKNLRPRSNFCHLAVFLGFFYIFFLSVYQSKGCSAL